MAHARESIATISRCYGLVTTYTSDSSRETWHTALCASRSIDTSLHSLPRCAYSVGDWRRLERQIVVER
jgi:hypothetical protein